MDGIINVLKPPGMTSHDVIYFIRKQLNISKVGHTGTLDPGVPGVLPICVGKATRVAEYVTGGTKGYRGIIKFGQITSTQDAFGEILEVRKAEKLTKQLIEECFEGFVGRIKQIPPMVSAVKIKGKKLYEWAREGQEVIPPARDVDIHSLSIIKFMNLGEKHPEVMFDVVCSKGTYIRTLCHDIGQRLGCGAHMSFLIRTASGPYLLRDAYTLEEILEMVKHDKVSEALLPINSAISNFPAVIVRESAEKSVSHGSRLYPQGIEQCPLSVVEGDLVRLKNKEGKLLALAKVINEEFDVGERQVFQPVKVFC